jgi:tRNA(Ile2) C34 agmatinyltransferase TiaS
MSEQFVGCRRCGFSAGKNDGYVASWRWCPKCGTRIRIMGSRRRVLRQRYLMRQLHYDPTDVAAAILRHAADNLPTELG